MLRETPAVLVVEADPDLADLYAAWLGDEEHDVRVAHDERAALAALDDVDVAVLGETFADDAGALRDAADDEGVPAVVVADDDTPLAGRPDRLVEPASAEALRNAVAAALAQRAYARGVEELFSLATERAAVETGGDGPPDERRHELDARVDELRDRLDDTLDALVENAGFDAAYRAVEDVSDED